MALELTRRQGQSIIAVLPDGTEIEFRVTGIGRKYVRMQVIAPPTIKLWRDEVFQRTTQRSEIHEP